MAVRGSTALAVSLAVAATLSAAVFWGLNGVATKLLYRDAHLDAFGLLAARGFWALPIFLVLVFAARGEGRPRPRDLLLLVVMGIVYGPVSNGFIAYGAQYTSAAHISMLISLTPPLTVVIGGLALRERVDALRLTALAVGMLGAVLLASSRSTTGSSAFGDACLLAQVLGIAAGVVIVRALAPRYNALFLTGSYGALGMLGNIAIGTAGGGAGTILRVVGDPTTAAWFFGEIVIGLTIYAQVAQSYALRTIGAGTVSLLSSYGSLAIGIVGSLVILGERIAPSGIVAGALIAVALGLALVPARRPPAHPNSAGSRAGNRSGPPG
jgi:drug/metabolite transporter (DMT)-like permease